MFRVMIDEIQTFTKKGEKYTKVSVWYFVFKKKWVRISTLVNNNANIPPVGTKMKVTEFAKLRLDQ